MDAILYSKLRKIDTVVSDISADYGNEPSTINLFDPAFLTDAGWTYNSATGEYIGTTSQLISYYGTNGLPIEYEPNTKYCLYFDAYTEGNQSSSDTDGLVLTVKMTDGNSNTTYVKNNQLTATRVKVSTSANMSARSASTIKLTGANYGNNIWHLSNVMLVTGYTQWDSTLPEYVPFVSRIIHTAVDKTVRRDLSTAVSELQSEINNITHEILPIKPEDTTFVSIIEASNLFNKNGEYLNRTALNTNTGATLEEGSTRVQYINYMGSGRYWVLYPQSYYGTSNIKLCLYDSSKTFVRAIIGQLTVSKTDGSYPCYFDITDSDSEGISFIGYCYSVNATDVAMAIKALDYPEEYIPYTPLSYELSGNIKVPDESLTHAILNPLQGKRVVFDGDSICHASVSNGGYAKYIGDANSMIWSNVGIAGGTITAELYSDNVPRHWVSRYIDTIHSNYSDLDYLILEGGTNDADLLENEQIGAIDYANYSTFDDTTFVGALESLFYKALNYYPTAKIGFIIAHKMGTSSWAGYDSGDSPANRRRRKFFEVAIQVCRKWGIPYIDLWEAAPLCPKIPSQYDPTKTAEENAEAGNAYRDGQHLTPVGYSIISAKIEAWMRTL